MIKEDNQLDIAVVGSGTAGYIAALLMKRAFPLAKIKIVSSSKIGIVGVGEGSTEHWKRFMHICDIPLHDMLIDAEATHKYGIRFENWSDAFPDYFHSVSGDEGIFAFGIYGMYSGLIARNMLLTNNTTSIGLVQNKIRRVGLHENTNQYHFDTNKLNLFFEKLCFERSIKLIDGIVENINIDSENGNITSVELDNKETVEADFWFDATGFARVLSSKLDNTEWNSYRDYLLCDSAFAFPTESDESGQIRPYTRARAVKNGWMWEIPTQKRRGNGYVFSSQHCTEDEAIKEASSILGLEINPAKTFKFEPGHLKKAWVKNCCSIGLAFSFVEPLEATSIGSTIQQVLHIIPYLASYQHDYKYSQEHYNKKMEKMMDNILTMIRLHYHTDKTNTQFWIDANEMKKNDQLEELLNLWTERLPNRYDFDTINGELFLSPHILHVAQGQNALNRFSAVSAIDRFNIGNDVNYEISEARKKRFDHELIDHAQSLRDINVWE